MEPALGSPACLTVHVCFPGARAAVMDNLNRQREEGRLCDLSIQVQGQVFRAHRCVLAASSPYFHDQVLLKNVTTVSLPSVMDPVAFESVLSSAYTGQLSLVHEDIVNYVTVASFLQMWHIVDKCTEILRRPRPAGEPGAAPGPPARQQSPGSTDCLYLETESRRKERQADALPPLATWRRPQQFPRWGRPRAPPAQQSPDPQPTFPGAGFSGCEEAWEPAHARNYQEGAPQPERAEAGRARARPQQRGPPPSPAREGGDSQESPERRGGERGESEAYEGLGEDQDQDQDQEGATKKEGCPGTRLCGFHPGPEPGPAPALEEPALEDFKGSVQGEPLSSSEPSSAPGPGVPGQPQWPVGPWGQQEAGGAQAAGPHQDPADFFSDASFSRDTYVEIQDGTGRVSHRPLLPASPDPALAAPEADWCGSSPSPALAGAPYTGKVHLCHCGKAYTLKSMRDRHVKMQHLNLRPFGCPICTKSFKMKHHLTKHLKTHDGLRPYECGLCGKKVVWRDSFLRHQARCQRLASAAGGPAPPDHAFAFPDGPLPPPLSPGQVKVEQAELHGDGLGGPLGAGPPLGPGSGAAGPAFKEEAGGGDG